MAELREVQVSGCRVTRLLTVPQRQIRDLQDQERRLQLEMDEKAGQT